MRFHYILTAMALVTMSSGQSFAQDDLFSISPSEVDSDFDKDLTSLVTDIDQLTEAGPTSSDRIKITHVPFSEFERELASLSPQSAEGLTLNSGRMLISVGFAGHVLNAVPPSWAKVYYPGEDKQALAAERPPSRDGKSGDLVVKGYAPNNYMAVDHVISGVTMARYYLEPFKDGGPYLRPANNFDPATKRITFWHEIKYYLDAEAPYTSMLVEQEAERKRRQAEAQAKQAAKAQATAVSPQSSNRPSWSSSSSTGPKVFKWNNDTPTLSKDTQEWLDMSKNQREPIYETQERCRLVADNDTVLRVRKKSVKTFKSTSEAAPRGKGGSEVERRSAIYLCAVILKRTSPKFGVETYSA